MLSKVAVEFGLWYLAYRFNRELVVRGVGEQVLAYHVQNSSNHGVDYIASFKAGLDSFGETLTYTMYATFMLDDRTITIAGWGTAIIVASYILKKYGEKYL